MWRTIIYLYKISYAPSQKPTSAYLYIQLDILLLPHISNLYVFFEDGSVIVPMFPANRNVLRYLPILAGFLFLLDITALV